MKYKTENNNKYIKENVPADRLKQYEHDLQIKLLQDIEFKIFQLEAEKLEEYSVQCFEGDAEALQDLKIWLSEKKVELNNM